MKVFISWSGDLSKAIAEELRKWLPSVLQAVQPYFSPDDITKGTRWSSEIGKELEESAVGILCMTSENLEAPWIMFEAGALSKKVSGARVCPLLFGVELLDIKGPLEQFQAARFCADEMKKTMRMMNEELRDRGLAPDVFEGVFNKWWPELEAAVVKILSDVPSGAKRSRRPDRDILEEILLVVRSVATSSRSPAGIDPDEIQGFIFDLRNWDAALRSAPGKDNPIMREVRAVIDIMRDRLEDLLRGARAPGMVIGRRSALIHGRRRRRVIPEPGRTLSASSEGAPEPGGDRSSDGSAPGGETGG